jgi:hypothetical protein
LEFAPLGRVNVLQRVREIVDLRRAHVHAQVTQEARKNNQIVYEIAARLIGNPFVRRARRVFPLWIRHAKIQRVARS